MRKDGGPCLPYLALIAGVCFCLSSAGLSPIPFDPAQRDDTLNLLIPHLVRGEGGLVHQQPHRRGPGPYLAQTIPKPCADSHPARLHMS